MELETYLQQLTADLPQKLENMLYLVMAIGVASIAVMTFFEWLTKDAEVKYRRKDW